VDGDEDRALLRQAVEEHRGATGIRAMWSAMPYRDSWSDLVGSRFWLEASISTWRDQIARSGAAIYTQGGWYDDFRLGGLLAFANLPNRSKILIGPWEHCRNDDFDLLAEYRRFFDATLKGVQNGVFDEPPILYYTVNAAPERAWRAAERWPPAATATTYYLQAGAAGESLASAPSGAPLAADEYTVRYDTTCPDDWPLLSQTCVQDEYGITYTSAPLTHDTEATGHPVLTLWLQSSAPDGNVFAYLEDVAPDGSVHIVSDARQKLSLRATHRPPYENFGLPWRRSLEEDARPAPADRPVQLELGMLPVSYVFRAGHRIRVAVTGADPRERMREAPARPPVWRIYADTQRPSALVLPLVR
jgi:uncharacterized protein